MHKKKLVYFGTPAPLKNNFEPKDSLEDERRLLAILNFNAALAEECQKSGIMFADVFNLTADEDGYNDNKWMIDSIHLKPNALNELCKSLKT